MSSRRRSAETRRGRDGIAPLRFRVLLDDAAFGLAGVAAVNRQCDVGESKVVKRSEDERHLGRLAQSHVAARPFQHNLRRQVRRRDVASFLHRLVGMAELIAQLLKYFPVTVGQGVSLNSIELAQTLTDCPLRRTMALNDFIRASRRYAEDEPRRSQVEIIFRIGKIGGQRESAAADQAWSPASFQRHSAG